MTARDGASIPSGHAATRAGVQALLLGLAPPRCRRCRIVVEREDSFCAACGTPLLTGG
jgi:predicted amidophosphoribosyltransferase